MCTMLASISHYDGRALSCNPGLQYPYLHGPVHTRYDWLLAKTCAYEFAACSAEAVCPACSLATMSVQQVSAWISRSLFSVTNTAPSLLVAGCAPSQFGYLTESLLGQSSCLRPVPEHNRQKSSVAQQEHAPWPNCWHLKQRLGRGVYRFTSNLSNENPRCVLAGLEHQRSGKMFLSVPSCLPWWWLPCRFLSTEASRCTRSLASSSFIRPPAACLNLTTPLT